MSELQPLPSYALSAADLQKTVQEVLQRPIKERPYSAQIMRQTPTAFIFLIDQSGSMDEQTMYRGQSLSKAAAVAQIINQTLLELVLRCQKGDEIRHYYDIALIGYGGYSDDKANLLWSGDMAGKTFLSPAELAAATIRVEEITTERTIRGRTFSVTEKRPVWLNPVHRHRTPMKSAICLAESLIQQWLAAQNGKDVYPPTVINITDGVATDATPDELLASCDRLKSLHTMDGHVLLMNIHVSDEQGKTILFPSKAAELGTDQYARLLYDMSSEMPAPYHTDIASLFGLDQRTTYVGMCSNADMNVLVKFMNIGTPTQHNQRFAANLQANS
ncbi:vWA domain-containing protein [Spirosoma litoris]